jgi:undecaprenyl-diphosphatase
MTAVLRDGRVYGWEVDFTSWAQGTDYPKWLFRLTSDNLTNSDTPQGAGIISAVCAFLWVIRLRIEAALVALSVPLHILGNFPKAIVERTRPSELIDGIAGVGGTKSFPSGHAEFTVTFYGFLVYIAMFYVHGRIQRALLILTWLTVVASVGFGRIAVGRHWPLDSIGGYVVGIGLLSGLIWLHRALYAARETSKD